MNSRTEQIGLLKLVANMPGRKERVAELARRYEAGEPLWQDDESYLKSHTPTFSARECPVKYEVMGKRVGLGNTYEHEEVDEWTRF